MQNHRNQLILARRSYAILLILLLVLPSLPYLSSKIDSESYLGSAVAASPIAPPTFDMVKMNASMKATLNWALSRMLPNGTATFNGLSNNLLSTSLVGRTLTYLQLEVGNGTTLAEIQKMINAEHILLRNPSYISFGPWPVSSLQQQLSIHRDVQKFLLRAYGLTLNQTARGDFVNVTEDIYLNMPGKFEYFDTVAWGFANAVWFAHYAGSPLPPSSSDFPTAVQDLDGQYNLTGAKYFGSSTTADYSILLHYIKAPEYTDSYFRLEGQSLNQTYLTIERNLAKQLVARQMANGNVTTVRPYQSYLVDDYAKDLDAAYYLDSNLSYVYSAYRAESFIAGLYLQSNGNITLPNTGVGSAPYVAYHMMSIAADIKSCSSSAWYSMLSDASKVLNYTLANQDSAGSFTYYLNFTNYGSAYSTNDVVAATVDSYLMFHTTNVLSPETSTLLPACADTQSTTTNRASTNAGGANQLSQIPFWVYMLIPMALAVTLGVAYEAKRKHAQR